MTLALDVAKATRRDFSRYAKVERIRQYRTSLRAEILDRFNKISIAATLFLQMYAVSFPSRRLVGKPPAAPKGAGRFNNVLRAKR